MGLFGPKPPVDQDEFDWLLACFAWLHKNLLPKEGEEEFLPPLALPDTQLIRDAKSAAELFDAVKALAGLQDWHCELRRGEANPKVDRDNLTGEYSEQSALGTFSVEGNTPVIHYNPQLLAEPEALVATFAHELAHLVIASIGDPPGGHDLHEHATDCCAAYLGFGIFLANSARQFEQWQDSGMMGWSSNTSGYLSEQSLVTAAALFVRLFGHDPALAGGSLKSYLARDFRKAIKYVDSQCPDVGQALDEVELDAWH